MCPHDTVLNKYFYMKKANRLHDFLQIYPISRLRAAESIGIGELKKKQPPTTSFLTVLVGKLKHNRLLLVDYQKVTQKAIKLSAGLNPQHRSLHSYTPKEQKLEDLYIEGNWKLIIISLHDLQIKAPKPPSCSLHTTVHLLQRSTFLHKATDAIYFIPSIPRRDNHRICASNAPFCLTLYVNNWKKHCHTAVVFSAVSYNISTNIL